MSEQKKVAAVTGATGYVACEVIYQLLEKGYIVHATVRSRARSQDLIDAFAVDGKPNPNLIIFEADLLKEGSFDEAFKGVDYVLHTASPFQLNVEDPQRDLVDPALNGTKNVLASVEKYLGKIKVVVVTSSVAAVMHSNSDPNFVFTESEWNNESSLTNGPYLYSKVLAEQAAWEWYKGKEDKIKLTTVNPSFVLGRLHLKRDDSTSIKTIVSILNGSFYENGAPASIRFAIVSVRDVGEAHVKSLEVENASGRYIVSSAQPYSLVDIANALKKDFPNNKLPTKIQGEFGTDIQIFSSEKAHKELGINLRGIDEIAHEMGESLVKFGLASKL